MAAVLTIENVTKQFPGSLAGRAVHALSGITFSIASGETLAVVGESGSGKSTLGRIVLRLDTPTTGRIVFGDRDITELSTRECRGLRAEMQMVFQDPWSALNPRLSIGRLMEEPFLLLTSMKRAERRAATEAMADRMRLDRNLLERFPAQLSGGQLQRVCIARAIATRPKLVVLDEPTSALDISVRAEIINLLYRLKDETGTAFMFISHDLSTVRMISDRIIVLYLGRVVESGPSREVFRNPQHPYTQALLSAHLPADPTATLSRHVLKGEMPNPIDLPTGCVFASRCPVAISECATRRPSLDQVGHDDHRAACIRLVDGGNRIGDNLS